MNEPEQFLRETVPVVIAGLNVDAAPLWGSMNATEMIQHLRLGIKMSMDNQDGGISTPPEKLESYKRFLMSDRPFGKNQPRPPYFEQTIDHHELAQLKQSFLAELERLLQYFEEHPEHTSNHDSFGVLSVDEWKQLHYKHFRHHFVQFGLIEE